MKQINEIDLNSYRDRVYQNAVNHGWHEEDKNDEHWLCLVISELMEAVNADRKNKYADTDVFNKIMEDNLMNLKLYGLKFDEAFSVVFEEHIKDTVEDELADACIRLLDLAGLRNLDLGKVNIEDLKRSEGFFNWTFTESMFFLVGNIADLEHKDSESLRSFVYANLCEILSYCLQNNIDIFWFIDQKMKYNESRPFKHGGKKY